MLRRSTARRALGMAMAVSALLVCSAIAKHHHHHHSGSGHGHHSTSGHDIPKELEAFVKEHHLSPHKVHKALAMFADADANNDQHIEDKEAPADTVHGCRCKDYGDCYNGDKPGHCATEHGCHGGHDKCVAFTHRGCECADFADCDKNLPKHGHRWCKTKGKCGSKHWGVCPPETKNGCYCEDPHECKDGGKCTTTEQCKFNHHEMWDHCDLRSMFRKADADNDGKVDHKEFLHLAFAPKFHTADDTDPRLTDEEFAATHPVIDHCDGGHGLGYLQDEDVLLHHIEEYDERHPDHQVDCKMLSALNGIGHHAPRSNSEFEAVMELWHDFEKDDKNHDGKVTLDERPHEFDDGSDEKHFEEAEHAADSNKDGGVTFLEAVIFAMDQERHIDPTQGGHSESGDDGLYDNDSSDGPAHRLLGRKYHRVGGKPVPAPFETSNSVEGLEPSHFTEEVAHRHLMEHYQHVHDNEEEETFKDMIKQLETAVLVDNRSWKQAKTLWENFKKHDQDGDHHVTKDELLAVAPERFDQEWETDEWLDGELKAMDLNADGKTSFDEFLRHAHKLEQDAQGIYYADTNGDHAPNAEELEAWDAEGAHHPHVDKFDKNGDGSLQWFEWHALRRSPELQEHVERKEARRMSKLKQKLAREVFYDDHGDQKEPLYVPANPEEVRARSLSRARVVTKNKGSTYVDEEAGMDDTETETDGETQEETEEEPSQEFAEDSEELQARGLGKKCKRRPLIKNKKDLKCLGNPVGDFLAKIVVKLFGVAGEVSKLATKAGASVGIGAAGCLNYIFAEKCWEKGKVYGTHDEEMCYVAESFAWNLSFSISATAAYTTTFITDSRTGFTKKDIDNAKKQKKLGNLINKWGIVNVDSFFGAALVIDGASVSKDVVPGVVTASLSYTAIRSIPDPKSKNKWDWYPRMLGHGVTVGVSVGISIPDMPDIPLAAGKAEAWSGSFGEAYCGKYANHKWRTGKGSGDKDCRPDDGEWWDPDECGCGEDRHCGPGKICMDNKCYKAHSFKMEDRCWDDFQDKPKHNACCSGHYKVVDWQGKPIKKGGKVQWKPKCQCTKESWAGAHRCHCSDHSACPGDKYCDYDGECEDRFEEDDDCFDEWRAYPDDEMPCHGCCEKGLKCKCVDDCGDRDLDDRDWECRK